MSHVIPPTPTLQLAAVHWAQMLAHLRQVAPQEGCGFLAGVAGRVTAVYPVPNQLASPTAFQMEPQAQIRALLEMEKQGWDLLAIYHSHPASAAVPSPTDIAQAHYPTAALFIVSLLNDQAGLFAVQNGQVRQGQWEII